MEKLRERTARVNDLLYGDAASAFFFAGAFVSFLFGVLVGTLVIPGIGNVVWFSLAFCLYLASSINAEKQFLRGPRTSIVVVSFLSAFFVVLAFCGVLYTAGQEELNSSELAVSAFSRLLIFLPCVTWGIANIHGARSDVIVADIEAQYSRSQRCKSGCAVCCWWFFGFLVALATVQTLLVAVELEEYYPSDGLYEVDGSKMFMRCSGTQQGGYPPVILEHGLSGNSLDWEWVRRNISSLTQVCSYDRKGYGHSRGPGPEPRTTEQIADELNLLLDAANISRPFVMGAFSMVSKH